jgi:alkyldihydroxyacetonephosphate synthase
MNKPTTIDPAVLAELKSQFSGEVISGPDDAEVLRHAYDWWPVAAMWRKQGKAPHLPEAVCFPKSKADAIALLAWAGKHAIPVTPWGAGSSVTGACLPGHGGITVDFSCMTEVLELNEVDRYVRVQPGIMGDKLEAWLNERGYTLNHSPQSLDRSTPGGWVSTFATGQYSSKYGGIEDLLFGLEVVLPDGSEVRTHLTPRTATGPDLRQFFIGAEGTLGLTTEVAMKIFRQVPFRKLSAFEFPDLGSGISAMREIMQSGLRPFLVRFYDEDEAWHAMKKEGYRKCVMFLGSEGVPSVVEAEFAACATICSSVGAVDIGAAPVDAWTARRFDFTTVEKILERPGGYAETIEIAQFWSGIEPLHARLKEALQGMAAEVMSHFSHVYDQGTSMYMILLGQAADDVEAEARLKKIWDITMAICLEEGATIAHHHGSGLARNAYIARERAGDHHLLARIKKALDPQNLLNPGKLGLSKELLS